jgi:hypothetical protein
MHHIPAVYIQLKNVHADLSFGCRAIFQGHGALLGGFHYPAYIMSIQFI